MARIKGENLLICGGHTTTSYFILIETITNITTTGVTSNCIMAVLATFVTVFTAFINIWIEQNATVTCLIFTRYILLFMHNPLVLTSAVVSIQSQSVASSTSAVIGSNCVDTLLMTLISLLKTFIDVCANWEEYITTEGTNIGNYCNSYHHTVAHLHLADSL